mmetsp:Transcript_20977/g.55963  ORF Transcript_20977/g.55963 Transcript_20977/m.55963 type:complete len:155 (-) Transcript_20977:145-609(-)
MGRVRLVDCCAVEPQIAHTADTGYHHSTSIGEQRPAPCADGYGWPAGDMIVSSDEPTIVEVPTSVPQGCNLCQMFDWFRRTPPTTAATELLLQDSTSRIAARERRELEREGQPATVSDPPRPKRGQRPYRVPFPGTPVDPASVGISVPRKREAV